LPRVRGAAPGRWIRPRLQRGTGLPGRHHRLERPSLAPALRDRGMRVGGLELKGPVMAASGTFGYGTEVPLLNRRKLGGIVSKGIFLRPRPGTPAARIVETPAGMLNAIGLQGPGVESLVRDYAPLWAGWEFPVLVTVNGE